MRWSSIAVLLLLILIRFNTFSQCLINVNDVPDTLCLNEQIQLENSATADNYYWDFCLGDFESIPLISEIAVIPGFGLSRGFRIYSDDNKWYGFATDRNNSKLYRFDFGNSLDNIPVSIDLGNPGNLLSRPEGFDLINQNGSWYGFVGYEDNGGHLIRLDFGNSLANNPSGTDIGSFVPGRIRDLRLIKQVGNLILVFLHYNSNQIYRVNYRDSFNNTILPEHVAINTVPGASLPTGIEITRTCGNWMAHVVSLGNNSVQQLNFGDDILGNPVLDWSYNFNTVIKPYRISIVNEGEEYFASIGNERDPVALINLSDLAPSTIPVELNNTGFPVSSNVFVMDYNGKKVIRCLQSGIMSNIGFEADCGSNYSHSYDKNPIPLHFEKEGLQRISLKLYEQNRFTGYQIDSVFIRAKSAPVITFHSDNSCVSTVSAFNAISTDIITSWSWDFGDGEEGWGQNPQHQYLIAGNYPVRLHVMAENGCSNYIADTIRIYDPPLADFRINDSILCSNNALDFENQSVYSSPDNVTSFSWNFNGEHTTSVKDTVYTFLSGGDKSITLTASIPGCLSEKTELFNLLEGPDVRFSTQEVCDGEAVRFLNETTGNPASYSWDFGDGNMSMETDPAHLFHTPGSYLVSLKAAGINGCLNEYQDLLSVHFLPRAGFEHELPCSRSPVGFIDTSKVDQANITGWSWSIKPAGDQISVDSDSAQHPVFEFYNEGEYIVSLTVTSNFGCRDTTSRSIRILPSPVTDFDHNLSCLGDTTFFVDASDIGGENIINRWTWQIGQDVYHEQSPGHVFAASGIFDVLLTVQADNLCRDKKSAVVTIHPLPSVDFIVENNCINENILLSSLATSPAGPIEGYYWEIESIGERWGSTASLQFAAAGDFMVNHTVNSENGCSNTVSRRIRINEVPQAAFDFEPEQGTIPFTVSFRDLSTGGRFFYWDFDDGSRTSDLREPEHTYLEEGSYMPSLTVTNEWGCKDSISSILNVVVPALDVSVLSAESAVSQGMIYFYLNLYNQGTITVEKMDIAIKLEDGMVIQESFSDILHPGVHKRYPLNFRLYDLPDRASGYICFELIASVEGYEDINSRNNTACLSLEPELSIREPYPNPTAGPVWLDLILPEKKDITLHMISSDGKTSLSRTFPNMPAGLNSIVLETEGKSQGNYILRIIYDGMTFSRKIGIIRY